MSFPTASSTGRTPVTRPRNRERNVSIPGGILLRLPTLLRSDPPRRHALALPALAAAGALFLRLAEPGRGIDSLYDEGVVVDAGWRVLAGEVPFRDFWHLHSPGTAWLLAGCFRAFGTSLAVERGLDAAVFAAGAALVCFLARRRSTAIAALAAAGLFALSPGQTTSLRPRDLGLLFALAALAAGLVWLDRTERRRWLVAAGISAGVAAWFKQDFAAAAALALMAAVIGRSSVRTGERARDGLVLVVSALAAFAPVPVVLAAQGAVIEGWRQAVVFPATRFAALRGLPISGFAAHARDGLMQGAAVREILAGAAPVLVYGLVLGALFVALDLLRGREVRASTALVGLGLLGFFLSARVRADSEHLVPPLALALVLFAWWADPPGARAAWRFATGAAVTVVLVAVAAWAGPPGPPSLPPPGVDDAFRARVRGLTGAEPDFLLAAADVASRTREGEPVFCGNTRHDVTSLNPALFYFAAGRPNATRYDNLHPGVASAPEVQREIAGALDAKRVRVVVLWREPGTAERTDLVPPSGATALDTALRRDFAPVRAVGRYEVRVRAGAPPEVQGAASSATPPK